MSCRISLPPPTTMAAFFSCWYFASSVTACFTLVALTFSKVFMGASSSNLNGLNDLLRADWQHLEALAGRVEDRVRHRGHRRGDGWLANDFAAVDAIGIIILDEEIG